MGVLHGLSGNFGAMGAALGNARGRLIADEDAWTGFNPTVLACATSDPEAIDEVMGRFAESEWRALDTFLARVPGDRKPATYKLWKGTQRLGGDRLAQAVLIVIFCAVPVVAVLFGKPPERRPNAATPADAIWRALSGGGRGTSGR